MDKGLQGIHGGRLSRLKAFPEVITPMFRDAVGCVRRPCTILVFEQLLHSFCRIEVN